MGCASGKPSPKPPIRNSAQQNPNPPNPVLPPNQNNLNGSNTQQAGNDSRNIDSRPSV